MIYRAFFLLSAMTCAIHASEIWQTNYRLDEDVVPNKYNVEIKMPNFPEDINFVGKVAIDLNVPETTKIIRIHRSNETKINSVTFDGEKVTAFHRYNATTEIMEIDLNTIDYTSGIKHSLIIEYEGQLYDDMYGFYVSTYKNKEGISEIIGTTQFQPTYARRAFPCFDEPFFKAKFSVSITHPDIYMATSNQPIETKRVLGGTSTTVFQETEKMSTYLVAFVVHKFAYETASTTPNKPMKVWAPKEVIKTAHFAATVSKNILEALETFTGVSYWSTEMKHLDQFAIPDFAAGAMENWGLVTYRETALLWDGDEKEKNRKNQQRVASVIAHEFSHMWFGDILTLNWWNTTWLNEGFARYCEYHILDRVVEDGQQIFEWDMSKQFVVEQQHAIFQKDAVEAALPLTNEVYSRDEIKAMFGSITYNKGACVIRMMEHFLGTEKFQHGIRRYLANNRLSSSTPNLLFHYMQIEDETLDIEAIMKSWTEKSGYPLITVSVKDKKLQFSQETFFYDESNNNLWHVPISYTKQGGSFGDTKPKLWLTGRTTEYLDDEINEEWVVVNNKQTGYYRVNYDLELWYRISAVLHKSPSDIDEINRAQIIDDLFNLARAGNVTYDLALDITTYLQNEDNYYAWYAAFNSFSYLRRRLPEGSLKNNITDHIDFLMTKVYDTVSLEVTGEESQIDMHKKVLVLEWACEFNNKDCYTKAIDLFANFKTNPEDRVDSNIRSIVYCSALRHASDETSWEFLLDQFITTTSAAHQVIILTALGCTRDTELLNRYLQMSVTPESGIRPQDATSVFNAVLTGNPEGVEVALKFLINYPSEIIEYYGSMNAMSTVILNVAERIKTSEHLVKFEDFIKNNMDVLGDAQEVAEAAINTAQANLNWIDQYQSILEEYFHSNNVHG